MSIFEINGGPVNHRYLVSKTKSDLAHMVMDYLREWEQTTAKNTDLRNRLAAAEQKLDAEKDAALQGVVGEETWRYWYRQFIDMREERDELRAENERLKEELEQPACVNCHVGLNQQIATLKAENERLAGTLKGKTINSLCGEIEKLRTERSSLLSDVGRLKAHLAAAQQSAKEQFAALEKIKGILTMGHTIREREAFAIASDTIRDETEKEG